MARPLKNANLKSKRLNIRCTDQEHELLTEKAKKLGIPISKLLLSMALQPDEIEFKTQQYTTLFTEINRIGTNINQSVRAINRADGRYSKDEIDEHVTYIKHQLQTIISEIRK